MLGAQFSKYSWSLPSIGSLKTQKKKKKRNSKLPILTLHFPFTFSAREKKNLSICTTFKFRKSHLLGDGANDQASQDWK